MSYMVQQSAAQSVPVKLVDDTDLHSQETGKTGANVTVRYKKYGDSSWSTKDVSGSGWDEIGNGYYEIDFSAAELNTAGRFDYQVECSGCLDHNGAVLVVAHNPLNVQQDASGYLKVKNQDGDKVAEEGSVLGIFNTLIKEMTAVDEGLGTTSAAILYAGNIEVGDVLLWNVGDVGAPPLLTVVTGVEGVVVTWNPALAVTPDNGDTVTVLPGTLYRTLQSLAIPSSPTAGSVNERIKAIDDKLPSGDISDFDEYRSCANVGYDGSTLTVNAWLEHRGQIVTDPTSCTVTVYDDAGAQEFSLSDETPDAQGVFKMTESSPDLSAGKSYYTKVQVVASGSTHTTIEGVATL